MHAGNDTLASTGEGKELELWIHKNGLVVQLVRTNESDQLLWRQHCKCAQRTGTPLQWCRHFKLCTADAVRHPRQLACMLCTPHQEFIDLGRGMASEHTQLPFMQLVDGGFAPTDWVWEARVLPGWPGLADLFFLGPKLIVQIDGAQHFDHPMFADDKCSQLERDMECNLIAWRAGARMLRLHHDDLGKYGMGTLRAVIALLQHPPPGPMLALSRHFAAERCITAEGEVPLTIAMQQLLHAHMQPHPYGFHVLTL